MADLITCMVWGALAVVLAIYAVIGILVIVRAIQIIKEDE